MTGEFKIMNYFKLILINQLSLPDDILTIINSFTFDYFINYILNNKKYYNNIMNDKKFYDQYFNKKRFIKKIDDAFLSRKNLFNNQTRDENDEHWAFSVDDLQLQAINCSICGDYIKSHSLDNRKNDCWCLGH
jgi:hypothetical protein